MDSQLKTPGLSDLPIYTLYNLLKPITLPSSSPNAKFINWGRTFACTPLAIFEPETEFQCEVILELARREGKSVRAVGVGHSPSDLACTNEFMLRTTKLTQLLEVNCEKKYIVAQAGVTLHDLHAQLAEHNLAMMNVGSISDQTLAGIVTTATHGSGFNFGVMSTHVLSLKLLLADGTFVTCSRQHRADLFMASICGLGSTGLILTIQLEVEPAFRLREFQETLEFDNAIKQWHSLVPAAEHVRMWWFPQSGTVRLSSSNRTQESKKPYGSWLWHSFFGFHVIQLLLFIGRFLLPINTWTGRFAAWLLGNETVGVDDSHRIFNVDCRYPQHTTEWAVPYDRAQNCLLELRSWFESEYANTRGLRPHFPIEIRFSAPDDIWLSPSNGQRTCWIGIVQYKPYGYNVPYRKLFERFESIVGRNGGRPHWAKAHRLRPEDLRDLYPRFDDFVRIIEEVDPHGLFRNEYINRHIFGMDVDFRAFKLLAG